MGNTYFLVHGAWCGAWSWDKLKPLLERAGHTVIAPDMPAHGKDTSSISEQNLEKYARFVESLISPLDGKVILVGHSFGGMIISQAACYIPHKIKKLVYISAFFPQDGQSGVGITKSLLPTFHEKLLDSGYDFILSDDGKSSSLMLESCADFIFNDIPRDEALILSKKFCPESNDAQQQPVILNNKFSDIPKAYIRCLLDKTIDINLQDKMIADNSCYEVYTLNTGHCPFESEPQKVADILLGL